MSAAGPLSAVELLVGATSWVQQATDPNTAGLARALGSILLRNGSFPAQPVEMYLKLAAASKGWAKQNLVNVGPVFNIQAYGAKGDGVTNDLAAINSAVAAAKAAGGGIVYVPATPHFYNIVYAGVSAVHALILIAGCTNVWMVGDGYASKIRQTGSCGGSETHMIQVSAESTGIMLSDFYLDNFAATDPDGAIENHGIQLLGTSTDTGPTTNIDITRVYFGEMIGDCCRLLGDNSLGANHFVENVRIRRCVVNSAASRSGIGVQRCNNNVICTSNWLQGNQGLHFEPTGGAFIEQWVIAHNIYMPQAGLDSSFDIEGLAYGTIGHNILPTTIASFDDACSYIDMVGNVLVYTVPATSSGEILCTLEQFVTYMTIRGNILKHLLATSADLTCLQIDIDNGQAPSDITVIDNVMYRVNAFESATVGVIDCSGITIAGNLLQMDHTAAGTSAVLGISAATVEIEDIAITGNMILGTGAFIIQKAYDIEGGAGAGASLGQNLSCQYNYASGDFDYGVEIQAGHGSQPATVMACDNMIVGTVVEALLFQTASTTIEGNASGFAAQVTYVDIAGGPNASSTCGPGSVCGNFAGGAYVAASYKETGSDSNTGWLGIGEADQVLGAQSVGSAATALFFAPGMGLAVAGATEIQWAAPRPATLRNLRGEFTAGSSDATNTYALRKNGATTAVTFAVSNGASSGSDVTHSFTVAAGDLIGGIVTKSGVPGTPAKNPILAYGFA